MATGALQTAAADPWAGIRQLQFRKQTIYYPAWGGDQEAGGYSTDAGSQADVWGADQDALNAGGYNSKYQLDRPEEVEPGLFKLVVQRPGMHKYDTAEVYYRVDPETGMGTMVDDPTATRQVSSREKWRDRLEKRILPIAGAVLTAGYGAEALAGMGGGAAPGAAGAAEAGGGALMDYGVGSATLDGATGWGLTEGAGAAASGAGSAVAGDATKASLLSNAGYGTGMTGAETSVFDGVLNATGSTTAAKAATDLAGSVGMNWLDTALTAGKSAFGNDWLTTAMSLIGSGVNQMNIEKAAQDQRDWLDQKDIDRRRRQAPGALPAMKTTVYTKGGG
jgi:hypothetical protein